MTSPQNFYEAERPLMDTYQLWVPIGPTIQAGIVIAQSRVFFYQSNGSCHGLYEAGLRSLLCCDRTCASFKNRRKPFSRLRHFFVFFLLPQFRGTGLDDLI